HFCSRSPGINTTAPGGKLIFHVFAAIAEFHRDIIVENTTLGVQAARGRGKRPGRRQALTPEAVLAAHRLIKPEQIAITEAAKRLGAARTTLGRHIAKLVSAS
ncbi:MAG: recombinase family protein, partial [Pseudomonadota bacterium]